MRWAALPLVMLIGCGASSENEPSPPGSGGGDAVGCTAPEVELPDGSCLRPGVPPDGCAEGFVHDGLYGCEPILPAEPCAPGMMAIPGDEACRSIMACGEGTWGDIPVEADSEHVDASYGGGDSDGSAERPWTTFVDAYEAAEFMAIIALAEGTYTTANITNKPVRIWGRCPDRVRLANASTEVEGLRVGLFGDGTEVHGVSVSGPVNAIVIDSAADVVVDRVWLHDTAGRGLVVVGGGRPASVHVTDSSIDDTHGFGILARGSDLVVERTVVRGVDPQSTGQWGRGINVYDCVPGEGCLEVVRGAAAIRRSVVEDTHELGVHAAGADLVLEGSVVRNVAPDAIDGRSGRPVNLELSCEPVGCQPEFFSTGQIVGSLLEAGHESGIAVGGSTARIERTVIRGILPRPTDGLGGVGVLAAPSCQSGGCIAELSSDLTVVDSDVAQNHTTGIAADGSHLKLQGTVVRGTIPSADGRSGRGVNVQRCTGWGGPCDMDAPREIIITDNLITESLTIGLFLSRLDATVARTVIQNIAPQASDGAFGDGVIVAGNGLDVHVDVSDSVIRDGARAGLMSFAATTTLVGTTIQCTGFDLTVEDGDFPGVLEDRGDNRCGCPVADEACAAVSAGLTPPSPLVTQ